MGFKQKFQIGDKVALVKQPYAVGTIINVSDKLYGCYICESPKWRKKYTVEFEDKSTNDYLSYELKFADIHSLAEHAEKYGDIPKLSKKEKEETKEYHVEFFNVGDIVKIKSLYGVPFPGMGKICAKRLDAELNVKFYDIELIDRSKKTYSAYDLIMANPNDITYYNELCNIRDHTRQVSDTKNKETYTAKCKYCGTPFDEIEESQEEPGACEYCIERRGLISNVVGRKSAYVDLHKFSGLCHEGDWIDVTEWTNREGFDIMIHYASDHDEDDRTFKMSYEELEAVMNIVNKFGMLPPIYTKEQENI